MTSFPHQSRRFLIAKLGAVLLLHLIFIALLTRSHRGPALATEQIAFTVTLPMLSDLSPKPKQIADEANTDAASAAKISTRKSANRAPVSYPRAPESRTAIDAAPATSSALPADNAANAANAATVPTVPESLEDRTATKIDYEAARRIAREVDKNRPRDDLSRLNDQWQRDSSVETTLGKGVAGAARPDCLHAYAGAGLLAPLFAGYDLLRGKACKM